MKKKQDAENLKKVAQKRKAEQIRELEEKKKRLQEETQESLIQLDNQLKDLKK